MAKRILPPKEAILVKTETSESPLFVWSAKPIKDWGRYIAGAKKHKFAITKLSQQGLVKPTTYYTLKDYDKNILAKKKVYVYTPPTFRELQEKNIDASVAHYLKDVFSALPSKPKDLNNSKLRDAWYDLIYSVSNVIDKVDHTITLDTAHKQVKEVIENNFVNPTMNGWYSKGAILAQNGNFGNTLAERVFQPNKDKYLQSTYEELIAKEEKFRTRDKYQYKKKPRREVSEKVNNYFKADTLVLDNFNSFKPYVKITEKDFKNHLGIDTGQFGNYVGKKEREVATKNVFQAFLIMADTLKIDPKTIGKNDLAIAFGARGKGGWNSAAAHYEPNYKVINLTKTNGAGTLFHEYMHHIDNIIGQNLLMGNKTAYASSHDTIKKALNGVYNEDYLLASAKIYGFTKLMQYQGVEGDVKSIFNSKTPQEVKPHLESLFNKVERLEELKSEIKQGKRNIKETMTSILQEEAKLMPTSYYKAIKKLDEEEKSVYWGKDVEIFARTNEGFLSDKIAQDNNIDLKQSAFLVMPNSFYEELGAKGIRPDETLLNKYQGLYKEMIQEIKNTNTLAHKDEGMLRKIKDMFNEKFKPEEKKIKKQSKGMKLA